MKNNKRLAFSMFFCMSMMFLGCSVDHTGIGPIPVVMDKYEVVCKYEYHYINTAMGVNEYRPFMDLETGSCARGEPDYDRRQMVCEEHIGVVNSYMEGDADFAGDTRIKTDSSGNGDHYSIVTMDNGCIVEGEDESGIGGRSDGLISPSGVGDFWLLNDNTGRLLGDNNLNRINGTSYASSINVSAKFAAWRDANTTAEGRVQMDGGDCGYASNCPVVLRYLELDVQDFTIVRPTWFAADVHVNNVRLYTLNNYQASLDGDNRFKFEGVKFAITGIVNGERISLLPDVRATVYGSFNDFWGAPSVAPKTIKLRVEHNMEALKINGSVLFSTTRTEARLRNKTAYKCLRGADVPVKVKEKESRASIESCYKPTRIQKWIFQLSGKDEYQIMQPASNTCLNLKALSQDKENGMVTIVGCSSHSDQLWKINGKGKVVHSTTGKCLNVHGGKENREGGFVSVYSCADTPDQLWDVISIKN